MRPSRCPNWRASVGCSPLREGEELRGDLGCYARAVISDEWPLMREGRESDVVLGWLEQIETTIDEMPSR